MYWNHKGVSCRDKLAETLSSISYMSTESDPDVWIKRAKKENGTTYYKYMLVSVDDVIHLGKDAQEDMFKLNQVNWLKEVFWSPDRYLGANINKVQLDYVRTVWSMTFIVINRRWCYNF